MCCQLWGECEEASGGVYSIPYFALQEGTAKHPEIVSKTVKTTKNGSVSLMTHEVTRACAQCATTFYHM